MNLDLIHFLRVRFMKLFKKLLVAPAALGLLSPISVLANQFNIQEVANYSSSKEVKSISDFDVEKEIAITKSRVDGLEANLNNFEAGGFSDTTTASFAADFLFGSEDGVAGNEAVTAGYSFGIKTKTSFTGDDTLQVKFDAGNADDGNLDEFDKHDKGDGLIVDGISYKFPIGDSVTAMFADNKDAATMFTVACAYGGPSDTLDDCGNVNAVVDNGGAMAGAEYDFGNGFTAAIGYAGNETGLMTKENVDGYGANVAYSADNYGLSVTYGSLESGVNENVYTALNGYYSFDNGLNAVSYTHLTLPTKRIV